MGFQPSPEDVYERANGPDIGWSWHGAATEIDPDGRCVFRFQGRFLNQAPFGYLDVLLTTSLAVSVVALSDAITLDVDHIELYLKPSDAFRLGPELSVDTDWPKWSSAAEVVDGEPDEDSDLTVVLVGR